MTLELKKKKKIVLRERKDKPWIGRKYLQNISDKGLKPKICKEHIKLNNNK